MQAACEIASLWKDIVNVGVDSWIFEYFVHSIQMFLLQNRKFELDSIS